MAVKRNDNGDCPICSQQLVDRACAAEAAAKAFLMGPRSNQSATVEPGPDVR